MAGNFDSTGPGQRSSVPDDRHFHLPELDVPARGGDVELKTLSRFLTHLTKPDYVPAAAPDCAFADFRAAILLHNRGESARAIPQLQRALESAQHLEDPMLAGASNFMLGVIAEDSGAETEALDYLYRALDFFQIADSPANEALSTFHIGRICSTLGNRDLAIAFTEEGLELALSIDDEWCAGICLLALASYCLQEAQLFKAHEHLRQGLKLRRESGAPIVSEAAMDLIAVAAMIASSSGCPELALRLFELEHRFRSRLGFDRRHTELGMFNSAEQEAREALGKDEQAVIQAEASALSLEDAIDLALSIEVPQLENRSETPKPPDRLTAREREVLRLVSEGLTNREIAQRLYISQGTVRIHVSNILGKLGASTRTEAVRTAVRQQLIRLD